MKKLFVFLLIGTLFLIPANALAREREMTIESATSTGLVWAGEVRLYGYEFIATAAAGSVGIYDSNSATLSGNTIKSEHQEATQYNSPPPIKFPEPIEFDDGLYVHINNANVILHYKK